MEITETLNEGLSRSYTLTATAEEVDARITQKLKELGVTAQVKGFRRGKAPVSVLRGLYGKHTRADVWKDVVQEGINDHLKKNDDVPVRQPTVKLKNSPDDPDINIEFSYECTPVVPKVDLSGIRIERPSPVVDDEEVTRSLEGYAGANPDYVDRQDGEGACLDDKVVISFTATVDQVPVDRLNATDFPVIIGSGTFIPGFEHQLLGGQAGERRAVEATIPPNHSDKKIAGKQALFDCEIREVKSPQAREIDDDLAKLFGHDTLAELKDNVRSNLQSDSTRMAAEIAKSRLLDELVERLDFEVPPGVLKDEIERVRQALVQPGSGVPPGEPTESDTDRETASDHQSGGTTGESGENGEKTDQAARNEDTTGSSGASGDIQGDPSTEVPEDELHRIAIRRLRTGFLFTEIAKEQDISVSMADMYREYVEKHNPVDPDTWKKHVLSNQQWRDALYGACLERKVTDWVLLQVEVTEKSASLKEIATMSRSLES